MNKFTNWIRKHYNSVISSIAFYPALISIGFLVASVLMLILDFSETGKHIKSQLSWLSLRDASTARSLLNTILGGIISLTVFSFSMVMILLNQAASQMSNRMLGSMIGNRFQQVVLGFYIGSIVYALFLLSTIRDISSGIYIPALSIYLLLILTVVDIFLFIYFLHYVTQSVKFDTIIKRIYKQTLDTLKQTCKTGELKVFVPPGTTQQVIKMPATDYYQGFDKKVLLKYAQSHDIVIEILHHIGDYVLQGSDFIILYTGKNISEEDVQQMLFAIDFYNGQPLDRSAYYGFHQLAEVAIKALSPGINDPETAVLSIHALTDLFRFCLHHFEPSVIAADDGIVRLVVRPWSFERLFEECFYPIWDYGKHDRYIQTAMSNMIRNLKISDAGNTQSSLFARFGNVIEKQVDATKL